MSGVEYHGKVSRTDDHLPMSPLGGSPTLALASGVLTLVRCTYRSDARTKALELSIGTPKKPQLFLPGLLILK